MRVRIAPSPSHIDMNPKAASGVVLAILLGAAPLTLAGQAGPEQDDTRPRETSSPGAALRLSGVVAVGGEARLAVVELEGQGGRLVRAGEALSDGTRVLAIGLDWLRVSRDGEERTLQMSSLPPSGAVPEPVTPREPTGEPAAASDAHRPIAWSRPANAEVFDAVTRVVSDPLASEADLSFALAPLLDLPADARVRPFFPGDPELEEQGLSAVRDTLARGELVRLMVEDGEETGTIYVMKNQARGGAAEGEEP
jgi:hypothetical protein